jgi:hypothetical protein
MKKLLMIMFCVMQFFIIWSMDEKYDPKPGYKYLKKALKKCHIMTSGNGRERRKNFARKVYYGYMQKCMEGSEGDCWNTLDNLETIVDKCWFPSVRIKKLVEERDIIKDMLNKKSEDLRLLGITLKTTDLLKGVKGVRRLEYYTPYGFFDYLWNEMDVVIRLENDMRQCLTEKDSVQYCRYAKDRLYQFKRCDPKRSSLYRQAIGKIKEKRKEQKEEAI